MLDGRRYLVNNKYYQLLKKLKGRSVKELVEILKIGNNEVQKIIDNLYSKNIISRKKNTCQARFIENKHASNDCLTFPRTIYWECTQNCNYRCIHCYSSSGGNNFRELPLRSVCKLIDELVLKGSEFLCIGGGEPLVYKDIYKVLNYCNKKGLMVEMTTNGLLNNRDVIKKLKKAGLKFIQISIDGATTETYEKTKGIDSSIKSAKRTTQIPGPSCQRSRGDVIYY